MLSQHHLSQKSLRLQLQDVRLEGRDDTSEIPPDQKMATRPIWLGSNRTLKQSR